MSTDNGLAAQRIKQKKLYKIRILLFGCRKEWTKKAHSGDSLACTPKTSELMDVSSRSSVIDRIPAGGYESCGCPTSDRNSTQSLSTREVSTQTEDDETKSKNEIESVVSSQSIPDRKDAGTQLSLSELANDSSKAFIQVQYSNVSKKFQPPGYIVEPEDEPQSDAESICEKISQKFSPLIVIDGSHSRVSGSKANSPKNQPPGSQKPRGPPARSQPARGQIARDTRQRSQPARGQLTRDNKTPRGQQRSTRRPAAVAFETTNPNMQNRVGEQVPPEGGSQMEDDISGTQEKRTQSEDQVPPGNPSACSRIPEILNRLCVMETKLKQQERCIKNLQCSSTPSKSSVHSKPKSEISICSIQNSTKSCKSTTSASSKQPHTECPSSCKPKGGEDYPDCQVLKKEFIDIFIKPDQNACSKKEIKKPITICPLKNNCEDARKMCIQCLEKSDILMQQFNHMFVKPGSQGLHCNLNKCKAKKQPSLQQCSKKSHPKAENCKMKPEKDISSGFPIPTNQSLIEPDSKTGSILDKCVNLVASKSESAVSNIIKVSSDSCLAKNNDPEPCDSYQKEVYESLMEQFIKYFTKPKTVCEQNPSLAQSAEGEPYSFERLCSELLSLFTRTRNLESNAVLNEDKLKMMTILTSNTDLKKNQKSKSISGQPDEQYEKSCKVEYISKDPPESSGDNENLPVLDSLVDEMMKLIDCRSLRDVVLTIMRRGCNVYHITVRERANGSVLGCLLAHGAAINEAISLGLFEDIPTFCELEKQKDDDPRDCPLDAIVPQREPGGDNHLAGRDTSRVIEFVTRVLGLPFREAERFFSLTNALKTAKKLSDQSLVGKELSRVTENRGLIGRGAITDNLIFLGSVHDIPGTTGSQLDLSELGEVSKHFLRLLSGLDVENKDEL